MEKFPALFQVRLSLPRRRWTLAEALVPGSIIGTYEATVNSAHPHENVPRKPSMSLFHN